MPSTDPTGTFLINFGELAKPAVVLIEKISDAVGGIAKPWQVKRVAAAQAKADLIHAQARVEVSELEERALLRMIREEGMRQENMESITNKSIPLLAEDAKPAEVSDDWLTHFFEKGRLISNQDMQQVWASMLAGEANAPGSFSKRTIDLASTLDKNDADLFTALCSFVWVCGNLCPLIFDIQELSNFDARMHFASLQHLDSIGLIKHQSLGGFTRNKVPKTFKVYYYEKPLFLQMPSDNNQLETGIAILTAAGAQLAGICGSQPHVSYYESIIKRWIDLGYAPYEPSDPPLASQSSIATWYKASS